MSGNKKSFIFLTIIQLAVFFLLANFGYGKSDLSNKSGSYFLGDSIESFQASIEADHDIHNPLNPSDIPEDLPVNEEEKELEEKEGGDGEIVLPSLRPYSLVFISRNKFSFSQEFSQNQGSIPLYILFHCWKNFLV